MWKAVPAQRLSTALRRGPADDDQFLATQLITSRIRSLMANHLTDVASSDQHTVKPWLDVKLDFAAPLVDPLAKVFLSLADAWV